MCRSIACGGRRCDRGPGKAERRRAYQREWLRAKRARIAATGAAVVSGAGPVLSVQERYSRDLAPALEKVKAAREGLNDPNSHLSTGVSPELAYARAIEEAGAVMAPEWERRVAEHSARYNAELDKSRDAVFATREELVATRNRMNEIVESHAHEAEQIPAIRDRFTDAEREEFDALYAKAGELSAKMDDQRNDLIFARNRADQARREATLEMLSEIRPMGAEIEKFSPGTSRKAKDAANAACALLPTEWVDHAEKMGNPLYIGSGNRRRAHYNPHTYGTRSTTQTRPMTSFSGIHSDMIRDIPGLTHSMIETDDYDEEYSGRVLRPVPAEFADEAKVWLDRHIAQTARYNKNRRKHRMMEVGYTENPDGTLTLHEKRRTTETVTRAEITSSIDSPSTMLHEMTHRMEYMNADISEAARAWRDDRAGDEEKSLIYDKKPGKPAEVGYRDGFADHYIGKVYGSSPFTEVVTMGMEMLMFDRHGGFTGNDSYKADPGHRDFMLGLLATAGATSPAQLRKARQEELRKQSERYRAEFAKKE